MTSKGVSAQSANVCNGSMADMAALGGNRSQAMTMVADMQPTPFEQKYRTAARRAIWVSAAITVVCAGLVLASANGIYGQSSDTLLYLQIGLVGLVVWVGGVIANRYFLS